MVLSVVGVVALVLVITLLVILLRRGGGGGRDLISSQLSRPLQPGRPVFLEPGLRRQAMELAATNRRIAAIALVRDSTGMSLGDAKAAVDRLSPR